MATETKMTQAEERELDINKIMQKGDFNRKQAEYIYQLSKQHENAINEARAAVNRLSERPWRWTF